MVIKEIYIENFGILHNYRYSVKEGLNQIYGSNGTGKSTLAVFVKAMFFGMPQVRNTKSVEAAERRKYKPWQGGGFGGYIDFEIKEKKYHLERTFGDREKEDTFKLLDAVTGMVSSDYSVNIGAEIFGIDREAFAATAWISGRNMHVEVNDSMHARFGNTLELERECANFEKGIARITQAVREYSRNGQRGRLYELKEMLAESNKEIYELRERTELLKSDLNRISETENTGRQKTELRELEEQLESAAESYKKRESKLNAAVKLVLCLVILLFAAYVAVFTFIRSSAAAVGIAGVIIIFFITEVIFWNNLRRLRNLIKETEAELRVNKDKQRLIDEYQKLTQLKESMNLQQKNDELENLRLKLYEADRNKSRLERELAAAEHNYEVLTKTKEYLIMAKESYVSSYMDTILVGLKKYLSLFDDKLSESVKLDTKMQIFMQAGALTREIAYFSSGIKDIIWLCERFAMIDALYKEELPLIILDDPFINLDDDMCQRAKNLLNKIAKDKQIIYMTCKNERRL